MPTPSHLRPHRHRGSDVSTDTDTVAVITDIHGNLPALEAALARIEELGIESVFCGGDLVGYGLHPNEVCELIAQRDIPTIYGNYDYAIARDLEDCGCAYVTAHDCELGQRSVDWTLANTTQESKDFLRGLPFDLHFPVGSTDVHLAHGSPRKVNESLRISPPACMSDWQRPKAIPCSCSATRTSLGCRSTAGCCSSTAVRSASPGTVTRAAPLQC